jgi:stage III sporulation protein AB
MLLKIIGGIFVISASSFLGYALSRDCAKRPHQLRVLQALFQMFENEVVFLSNVLTEAFEKISTSNNDEVASFFKATVKNLKTTNISANKAWETALNENIKKTALNKEDEAILISFGKMLGNSDIEGQVKNIRLTINQIKLQEQKAEESRKKNEKMYRSLGILGGLAVVIILM